MVPFSFAGETFEATPDGALFWRAQQSLLVADLHLEKASWFALGGQFLPPYDSHATLTALAAEVERTGATRDEYQEALTDELLSAKALVAPSLGGESFGMVLTRAFACATPVVASDITGYRDVMTDETGLLVPPDDSDALAGGLSNLLGDESRRRQLGESARRLAQERYSWDDIARRLSAIYEELT